MDLHRLHIVTVATESKYYFPYLVASCNRNGKELDVVGYGEKWEGFNWRFLKIAEYLKTKNPHDIVCVVDGYDVLCTRPLNEMVHTFLDIKKRTHCKMVVSDEHHCFIYGWMANEKFGKCNGHHLSAGLYIAEVKDMMEIIQNIYTMNPQNDADDQILMMKYCNLKHGDIYVDTDNELFLSYACSLSELEKKITYVRYEGKEIISYGNHQPFFLHAPIFGYMDNIIVRLGYNKECNIRKQLFRHVLQEKVFLYFPHLKTVVVVIFIVMVILLLLFMLDYILYFSKFYYQKQKIR